MFGKPFLAVTFFHVNDYYEQSVEIYEIFEVEWTPTSHFKECSSE